IERMAETDDHEQTHRDRSARRMQPFDQRTLIELWKQQQRGEKPSAEEQQGDAGDALRQPMLTAMMRRAEPAHSPQPRGAIAQAHFATPNRYNHWTAVSSTDPTIVRIETTKCGHHRQMVRWGESGRDRASAMMPPA